MSKFNAIIHGSNFKRMDSEKVKQVKDRVSKMPQCGIFYLSDNEVVLTTSDLRDILDCFKNKKWAHSKKPSRVASGWTVYVVPNNKEMQTYEEFSFGVQFTATQEAYNDAEEAEMTSWSSELS